MPPMTLSWNLSLSEVPLDRRTKMFHLSRQEGSIQLRLARSPIHNRESQLELLDSSGENHTTIAKTWDTATLQAIPEIQLVPEIATNNSETTSDVVLFKFSGDEPFLKSAGKFRFRWTAVTPEGEEMICDSPTLEEMILQKASPTSMKINGETQKIRGNFELTAEQTLHVDWTGLDGFQFQIKTIPPQVWIRGAQKWGKDLHVNFQNQRSWNFEIERLRSEARGETGFFDATQPASLETRTAVLPLKSANVVILSPLGLRYQGTVNPGKVKELENAPTWRKRPPEVSYALETSGIPDPSGNAQPPAENLWNIKVDHGIFPPTKSFFEWTKPQEASPYHFETGVEGANSNAISLVTGLSIYKYTELVSFADLRAQKWIEKMFGSDSSWAFQRWGMTLGVFQYLFTPTEASSLRIMEGIINYRLSPGVVDRDPTLFVSLGATNVVLPTITQATLPGVGIGWNRSGPWGVEKILRKLGFSNRKKWFDGHLMAYHLPGATAPMTLVNLRVSGRMEIRPGLCFEGGWGIQYISQKETAAIAALTASAARGFLGLHFQF